MKTPPANLDQQLEQLKQLKPEELHKRWQAVFGANPPAKIRSSLMIQAIARRLQEKAFGGHMARNGKRSGGNLFFRGALYELLSNPIYIGEVRHKSVRYPGMHEPIIDRALWDGTQLLLQSHASRRVPRITKSVASPLTGKLFDESGESLTPSHAVKGERRYRYYVSRNLLKDTADSARRSWRLPAPEIERIVASAASTILSDKLAIAEAARTIPVDETQLPSIFSTAAAWMKRLRSDLEVGIAFSTLVDRVDLIDPGIRVSVRLPNSNTQTRHAAHAIGLTITRVFPMRIRRRGFEMRLVIEGTNAPAPLADLSLIKTIARGRLWADDLLAGRMESVAAIAKREGVRPNYVRRLTRLAFLAPRIVEAIVAGQQPPELTAKALTERTELPLLWSEQERAAGIN
jgi:site-specific DNA recombinase